MIINIYQHLVAPIPIIDPPQLPHTLTQGVDATLTENSPLIMVVEDNAELREFMVAELATTYRIRSAANGYEGWMLAKEELPDVIISDLMMPRMDGYSLIEQLRNRSGYRSYCGYPANGQNDVRSSRRKGFEYGADEYLTKPFQCW